MPGDQYTQATQQGTNISHGAEDDWVYRITRRMAHLANAIEPSVSGGDAALCQITFTLRYTSLYQTHISLFRYTTVLIKGELYCNVNVYLSSLFHDYYSKWQVPPYGYSSMIQLETVSIAEPLQNP